MRPQAGKNASNASASRRWLLHEEMIQAATAAVRELQKRPRLASLRDIAKLFDLASILGRRACGMPLNPPAADEFEQPVSRPEVETALAKIYVSSDCSEPSPASAGGIP